MFCFVFCFFVLVCRGYWLDGGYSCAWFAGIVGVSYWLLFFVCSVSCFVFFVCSVSCFVFFCFLCQGYWLDGGYSWAVPGLLALVGVFHLLSCGWGYWLSWLWLMLGLLAWLVGGVFPALLFLSQCAVVPFS